jgi:hypothetical protein
MKQREGIVLHADAAIVYRSADLAHAFRIAS